MGIDRCKENLGSTKLGVVVISTYRDPKDKMFLQPDQKGTNRFCSLQAADLGISCIGDKYSSKKN